MKTTKLTMSMISVLCLVCILNLASISVTLADEASTAEYSIITSGGGASNPDPWYVFAALPSDSWELCYGSDDIYIYERWVTGAGDHKIRERKGEMYVNCSFDKAVQMLSNYKTMKDWTADVKENTLVKRVSPSDWITYTEFNLPWPFENRDVVSEYRLSTIKAGSQVLIKINSVDNLVSKKEGVSRISNYQASWAIKRIDGTKVWICFTASCDVPPAVPRFIQDPVVRKTFHKNLLKLRTTLE